MPDHQVRPNIRSRFERLVDGLGVPDGVFEGAAAVMGLGRCATAQAVADAFHAPNVTVGLLRDERAEISQTLDQMAGDVPELGGEILMNEENVHRRRRG